MTPDMFEDQLEEPAWHDAAVEKPPPYITVEVMLSDGMARLGFWAGSAWLVGGAEAAPVGWRPRIQ